MKRKVFLAIIALMVLTALFSGCEFEKDGSNKAGSSQQADGPVTEADVPYAGPMVEKLLTAIENRDYEAFSKDLDDAMKAAMNERAFGSLADLLAEKAGRFEKVSFGEGTNMTRDGTAMTVIVYNAIYSEEPGGVLVTVTFSGKAEKKIIGLYFNSSKLREQ